jgi:hypothetical protein
MVSRCQSLIDRPLSRYTSSARWIRCGSLTWMRAAAAGSTTASSACIAAQPRSSASAVSFARGRIGLGHRRQALQQCTEIQTGAAGQNRQRPRARMRRPPARASLAKSAAEYGCHGSRTSIR